MKRSMRKSYSPSDLRVAGAAECGPLGGEELMYGKK